MRPGHGYAKSTAMPTDPAKSPAQDSKRERAAGKRPLPPAAERALAEAARRAECARKPATQPKEIAGRDGLEPTRYGDWETNGLASDF